jgi:SAM-dependent methyltransferase
MDEEEVDLVDSTPWLFDELSHAGEEHLDPAYVAAYDRKAQTDPADDLTRLRDLGLGGESTLIDFGAGTGTFALAAAPLCRRVVAVDVSAPMLEQLRERARANGLANVEAVQSGFLTYRHRGEPADFAYSRNALHHLPDFWKGVALHSVAGALRPGGAFLLRDLVYSFDPGDAGEIVEAWLARAPLRPEDGFTAADLATHVRTEHSTYTWLLEPLLQRAGFELRDAQYPSRVFAVYTCVKQ